MMVLGIESSCDETAASVVNDKGEILSNIVLSQLETHAIYGGVVPEIAAREHLDNIDKVILAAMRDAEVDFSDLDGVAATCGPGLIGGVMIGMMSAKAIASVHNIPFLAINHLEGHLLTARLTDKIEFPYLVLLVSGGHTQLIIAEELGKYRRLGATLDDAAGECFDKSAKLMGLSYPGGQNIEKIACECVDREAAIERFKLPLPMRYKSGCDLSFSGLKTAVRLHVDKFPEGELERSDVAELSCALEMQIAKALANRSEKAISQFRVLFNDVESANTFVVCGGVSANREVRQQLQNLALEHGMMFYAPPAFLSGDNGAMIAWAGIEKLSANLANDTNYSGDSLNFAARPRWPLDPETAR